jgi:hypothetical protein
MQLLQQLRDQACPALPMQLMRFHWCLVTAMAQRCDQVSAGIVQVVVIGLQGSRL